MVQKRLLYRENHIKVGEFSSLIFLSSNLLCKVAHIALATQDETLYASNLLIF